MLLDLIKVVIIYTILVLSSNQNIIKIFYQTRNSIEEIRDIFYSLGLWSLIKFLIESKKTTILNTFF